MAFALDYPAYGRVCASNELRKQGVFISPSGVRCVWQSQDLASYSKWPQPSIYTTKPLITAVDLLNDRVLPFFEKQGMLRNLTDRGTEFCGKAEQHYYELFLAVNDIEHTKTKSPH